MPTLAKNNARDHAARNDITRRLAATYADQHAESYVAEVVSAAYRELGGARVRIFLPILVERLARERLGIGAPSD